MLDSLKEGVLPTAFHVRVLNWDHNDGVLTYFGEICKTNILFDETWPDITHRVCCSLSYDPTKF